MRVANTWYIKIAHFKSQSLALDSLWPGTRRANNDIAINVIIVLYCYWYCYGMVCRWVWQWLGASGTLVPYDIIYDFKLWIIWIICISYHIRYHIQWNVGYDIIHYTLYMKSYTHYMKHKLKWYMISCTYDIMYDFKLCFIWSVCMISYIRYGIWYHRHIILYAWYMISYQMYQDVSNTYISHEIYVEIIDDINMF